jgi:hypothetical protein
MDAIGVQQQIIDAGICLCPSDQFKELGMQRRFAAGQLQNLDATLPVDDALNPFFQIVERNRIHCLAGADG